MSPAAVMLLEVSPLLACSWLKKLESLKPIALYNLYWMDLPTCRNAAAAAEEQ